MSIPTGKYYLLLAVAVLVVIIDQVSKYIIVAHIGLYESITVIPGFFNIVHVQNPGAAFGLFSQQAPMIRNIVLIGASVIAMGVILYLFHQTPATYPLLSAGFALILGGAAGNMIDRLRWGKVVDFIDLYIASFHWPAFNVADSAISVGMVVFAYYVIFRKVPI
jgi:signal peptidase II